MASENHQLVADAEADIDEVVKELSVKEVPTTSDIGSKKRSRKLCRLNSKENVVSPMIYGPRSWKNSRRSRNGYGRGLPKKGGAGGKGVWGKPGSELLEAYEDMDDPNFDNENMSNGDIELKAIVPGEPSSEIKKNLEPIILEYFEVGDTHEAAIAIEDCVPVNFRDVVVEHAIEIAMDHKPSHREMTSVLISDLFGYVLNVDDITKALESLLANLDDLVLDVPDAPTILGNFIARAIADDCIPPKFIIVMKGKTDNERIQEALSRADTLLSIDHGLVRLHNVWGVGGALRPVKALTRQMTLLLQEFLCSGDIEEASRCLRVLEVPHFHHELVYEAIVMALEANSQVKEEALCKLLKAFDHQVLITTDQMERGFLRVIDDLPDICMDVPLAYIILDRFVDRCQKENILTENIIKNMPNRGRKRFVSEGDEQFLKNHRAA